MTPTYVEAINNLTGYDEDEIETRFGIATSDYLEGDMPVGKCMRALLFGVRRREGIPDDDAYDQVKKLSNREVLEFFDTTDDVEDQEDGKEADPFPPVTPAGKDSETHA